MAKKYLDPSRMTILIVGDRAKVEPAIKDLPFAKVVNVLDAEVCSVATPVGANVIEEE